MNSINKRVKAEGERRVESETEKTKLIIVTNNEYPKLN